jgi:hypothetical protein
VIHEYRCEKCGETFVGDGKQFESHNFTETGAQCDGNGVLMGTWSPLTNDSPIAGQIGEHHEG